MMSYAYLNHAGDLVYLHGLNRGAFCGWVCLLFPMTGTAVRNSMSEQSDTPKVYLYIQMQLCQEVDLKDWLNRNVENRSRQEATKIFLQVS